MKKVPYLTLTILAAILTFSVILFLFILNQGKGALQITSKPSARVYLDGKDLVSTPLCECDAKNMLSPGEYTLKLVSLSGNFQPFEQTITISSNIQTVVDKNFAKLGLDDASIITLSQIQDEKNAQISVVTFPSGAQVFLDDVSKGKSPVLLKNLNASDHELKVSKKGFQDKIVRIKTMSGYRLDALIYMAVDSNFASQSASPLAQTSQKILILNTPTGFLRVRDQPSLNGNQIGQVNPGESFDLIAQQPGWFEIKFDQTNGWVSSQYAKKQ